MAIVTFRGDAAAIAQVTTITIDTYDVATTYKVTINGKVISTIGTGGTVAATATALYQLLVDCQFPEFAEITWTNPSAGTILATSTLAGRPFTLTATETGGTGGCTATATTASSGPADLSITSNYSTGALPSAADTMVFENLENGLLYNVGALSAIALARVVFKNCKTGIGLMNWNPTGYWEYRTTFMLLQATIIEYDNPNCPYGRINNQTTQMTMTVTNTGSSPNPPLESLLVLNVNNSSVLNVNGGTVAVAGHYSEVSTIDTINQGYNTQQAGDAYVRIGRGVTLEQINRIGGTMTCEVGISGTLTQRAGASDITILNAAVFPTIVHYATSSIFYLSSGTITTMTLGAGAKFDSERNQAGFIITNVVQAYLGASFLDKNRKATWAGIKANGCGINSVEAGVFVDRGESQTWLDS